MGNPKQKWTEEEENALWAGITKHGTGKWKNIQKDPEFNKILYSRSNIDLKDKWRNLSVTINGQVPRDRARTLKPKGADFPASPMPISHVPASSSVAIVPGSSSVPTAPGSSSVAIVSGSSSVAIVPAGSSPVAIVPAGSSPVTIVPAGSSSVPIVPADPTPTDVIMEDSSKGSLDGKTTPKYNALIYEALSTLNDPNGSDTGAIASFIEQKQEVPQNFRRSLSTRLRRLVQQDKLEKVQQNCYRLRKEGGTSDPIPKPKEIRPRLSPINSHLGETLEEAAVVAAYKVAEVENKSFVAAEAVKELERVTRMAEEAEAFLQLAQQIYERCAAGEVVMVQ